MCRYQRSSEPSWHEPSVEECIVDGLAIGQKHNTEKAILHLRYLHPAPNSPISLNSFSKWRPNRLFDPFLPNDSAIRPATYCLKVTCELHSVNIADSRSHRSFFFI